MPSYKLIAPFVVLALVFLYLGWEVDASWSKGMIPCLVVAAVIFVFSPQINWWWWRRNPPDLEPTFHAWVEQHIPFYSSLDEAGKRRFRSRVFLLRGNTDWTPMAWPDDAIPIDIKLAIASQAAIVGFHREEFLFEKFEKVIVYPKPFLSPTYPFPHASELYEPDGCLIFSADQVLHAIKNPGRMFNVALYEYARVFERSFPLDMPPGFADGSADWEKLEAISGMSREYVEKTVGLSDLDLKAVQTHHFFTFS